ncbi:MAG TPA: hypothetical protein VK689_17495 [Armatimonadota bacterium]|nr:hypothetical protein [Armatimonadota bacterium]
MTELEYTYLRACHEMVRRQGELIPLLAATLGVPSGEVFYSWMRQEFPAVAIPPGEEWRLQIGRIRGTDWDYFFHGFECDLRCATDGRYVRIEWGPRGRLDGYGVLQFVMTSKAPWTEFPALQAYLAEKPPPYDHYSGSHKRMSALWERMEELGFLEPAAPDLCALVEAHTTREPGGRTRIDLPDGLSDKMLIDSCVCNRLTLTERAQCALSACPEVVDIGESR